MQKLLFLSFLIFSIHAGYAQEFGGNPLSTDWRQINTDTVRVIFPKGLKAQAQQVVNTVTYINRHDRTSIGNKELKINIVLQNRTVESNGFVALSPFRSVFQITPPEDNFSLGSLNWTRLLSLHEYRHALQNMNFRSGIGHTFYRLFGENGQALITNLLIPDWFWEGDAVFMETALSNQGRGRLPSFLEPFKSLYYTDKNYTYAKIRNGSLRDMIPSEYPLGYMMTAYGRDTLGIYFWELATQEALLNHKLTKVIDEKYPVHPFHPFHHGIYPLNSSLNYFTGSNIKGFYHKALYHFSTQWKTEKNEQKITPVTILKKNDTRSVLNYRYPHALADGSILAMKYGYALTPRIVRVDSSGKENTIVKIGNNQNKYYTYAGHKIAWVETRPNARRGWIDYSVLRLYDMDTRHTTTLSHQSRYFSPALSSNGEDIVVVNISQHEKSSLLILNAKTGNVTDTLINSENYFYTYPVFANDNRDIIAAVRDSSGKMALMQQSIVTGKVTLLSPFYQQPMGPPTVSKKYIFFPAAYTSNIQLYALRRKDGKLFGIASRPLGNYSIAIDTIHHQFVFDEYTVNGYELNSIPMNSSTWKPVDTDMLTGRHNPYVPKAIRAEGGSIANDIPEKNYPVSRYRQIKHLFYMHGLNLTADLPNISLYAQSQDILNTLQLNAGVGYNFNENSPSILFNATYAGWFPVLQFGYTQSFNRNAYTSHNDEIRWREASMYAGAYIPLTLSSNLYNRWLSVGATIHRNVLHYHASPVLKQAFARINYLEESLSFTNSRISSLQQINSKFGQNISLNYLHTINHVYARQLSANISLFFPGLFQNQSLYFTGAFSKKDNAKKYKFSDNFNYVDGYGPVPYRKIYKAGIHYQLPLAYPDWGLTWAYLLRVRLHLFFNYSHATMLPGINPSQAGFRSAGAAIYLDTRMFSYLSIPIGIQYNYLLDKSINNPGRKSFIEVAIPLTIFQ